MFPRLAEVVLRIPDVLAEAAFWQQGIGLIPIRSSKEGSPVRIFDLGGPRLELGPGEAANGPERERTFNLKVADAKAITDRMAACGGQVVREVGPAEGILMGYVRSPGGITVGLLQGEEAPYRARIGQMARPDYWGDTVAPTITEVVLKVADVAAEARFWEEAVGLLPIHPPVPHPDGKYRLFELAGPRLELAPGREWPPINTAAHPTRSLMFLVPDVNQRVEQIRSWGATILKEPRPIEDTFIAYVASPSGQSIGLLQGDDAHYRQRLGQRILQPYWTR